MLHRLALVRYRRANGVLYRVTQNDAIFYHHCLTTWRHPTSSSSSCCSSCTATEPTGACSNELCCFCSYCKNGDEITQLQSSTAHQRKVQKGARRLQKVCWLYWLSTARLSIRLSLTLQYWVKTKADRTVNLHEQIAPRPREHNSLKRHLFLLFTARGLYRDATQ